VDIDYYPLDATFQPIPHPPNSPPIKSISLQFREKDVVGDRVKGLTEVHIDIICSSKPVSASTLLLKRICILISRGTDETDFPTNFVLFPDA